MLVEAADLRKTRVGADVCVIGAGPAGLAVAAELSKGGVDVVVLEAGGRPYDRLELANLARTFKDHWGGAQSLTRGRNRGEPYYPLRLSRTRGLGGSTNALRSHGLRVRHLDALDFEARFDAGWPMPFEELHRFAATAERFVGLGGSAPVDWTPRTPEIGSQRWSRMSGAPFRHAPRRTVPERAMMMAAAASPRLITAAVVAGLGTVKSNRLSGVEVARRRGGPLTVQAEAFVLAAGGIDNARLLLAARPVLYAMEEAAGQVGRNFMEHPHFIAGYLVPSSDVSLAELGAFFGDPAGEARWLTAGDGVVRREDLLRVAVSGVPVHPASLHAAVPAAGELARLLPFGPYGLHERVRQAATAVRGSYRVAGALAGRIRGEARSVLALPVMIEQPPDPASRVALGSRVDRTGLALPELHWRVGNREFASARRTIELMAEEAERSGVGEVISLWDDGRSRPDVVTGGWHHMGTTRMSVDPSEGVVDADCKVHGLDNLFVAGSSVFASSGYANPTLTLVALAARLGEHLAAGRS